MRWIAPDLFTYAYHDEPGDRLLIMQATEDATAKQALADALKP